MEVKVNEHCLDVSRERGKKPLFRGGRASWRATSRADRFMYSFFFLSLLYCHLPLLIPCLVDIGRSHVSCMRPAKESQ